MAEEANIAMAAANAWQLLIPRKRQIVLLIARGLSNKDVARKLGVSDGTVKVHVHRILRKLGAQNRYNLMCKQVR